ncbi:ferritin [Aequorivita antarctica]|uniref:Ferritin n=1 Tax=Aequorivita antarctica TaxID=153266 RepID=A0A5C6Z402_9FLAO|nr:ferritin [Aequorivita antarctica]TXD74623.1 ferritin [Aequorivita antarctica]SRX72811.1 putative bacterial non-heme ferritin [Aequorivita antarctica]
MDTNRLSKKIEDVLNKQVTQEANAAQIYLSYAIWADSEGYAGIANLLFRHSGEERNHMMKVIEYIQERGGKSKISALSAPPKDPKNLQECFEKIFQHEVDNTTAIYGIVNLSQEEKDWATWNFGQWFVKEQIEEETLVMDLLDKLKIAGGDKATSESLLYLDTKIGDQEDDADLARDASVDNP